MADKKISALTGATTPLAGTEVLPIVQGGSTVKVSVDNLTAGRAPAMSGATLRNVAPVLNFVTTAGEDITGYVSNSIDVGSGGKLVFGTKRNGNTPLDRVSINAAGDMTLLTSNLVVGTAGKGIDFSANGGDVLTQYDEGTWNVVWTNLTGTPTNLVGHYTRVGRMVTFTYATGAGAISGTAGSVRFTLPFTPAQQAVGTSIAEGPGTPVLNWIYTNGSCYPMGFGAAYMIFSGTYFV